eukprot:TRINITY_DN4103_c0_g3_i2.p1 TRINITY_DN4103_c0_g3~~TRINITY_DN4103_c0_g3_i2.p1  ORF type:complete len:276 (+),score=53.87 TRINITY_DN4103_c0_g3_i2:93-920(+)
MQSPTQYPRYFSKESLEETDQRILPALKFTKFCDFYRYGNCLKGSSCTFAHDVNSMQAQPDLRKTVLCIPFSKGYCRSGASCNFAHGRKELRHQSRSSMAPEDMSYAKSCPDVKDEDVKAPKLQTVCTRFLKGKCRSKACKYLHPERQNDESNESGYEGEGQYLLNLLQESFQVPNDGCQGGTSNFNFPGTCMMQEMKGDAAEASHAGTCSTDMESDEFSSGSESGRHGDRLDALLARLQLDAVEITEKNTFIQVEEPPVFFAMRRSSSAPARMK